MRSATAPVPRPTSNGACPASRAIERAGIAKQQAQRIAAVIVELVGLRHPAHG
jgi:hypothetical protein